MSEQFDPYYEWLGIPPRDQPANHYRLLGIEVFEENLNVIERSADRQMGHVRTFQNGQRAADSQRLLNELSAAKITLLRADKKAAYDRSLREQLAEPLLPVADDILPPPMPVLPASPPPASPAKPEPERVKIPKLPTSSRFRRRRSNSLGYAFVFLSALILVFCIGAILAVALGVLPLPDWFPIRPEPASSTGATAE